MSLRPIMPIIVDEWSPNEQIKGMRKVLAVNSLIRYESLELAYRLPHTQQAWFYNVLYESGLYPVFEVFNVPATELVSIKGLIDYNYNPSLDNLYILLESVIPSDTEYTVDQGQGWVTITIAGIPDNTYTYPFTVDNTDVTLDADNLNGANPLLEVPSVDFEFNTQNTYILRLYVMAGIKLTVTLTIADNYKKFKKQVAKVRDNPVKLKQYYENMIKKGKVIN